ncbi:MAG: tRNA dihydrouridine(20/20a) synthase DusA [Candidatus Thiocaldithrix dubininis]|uniref:tRNA-dihydrouridine(20/20a) synthase n=1 Tax=Candidatus Thiocaldithrix dubininis TaxID=3080823 RepID=A0AA95H982_9GAMM|nr:MAG: tRNA dihydrouridine(20/20a) synthase DusA [Candidatus Thiocaldithrix dubininis]
MSNINRQFTVAPMLDWTDRHCRYFHRLLTKQALLYTEMVTTGALLQGDAQRHLAFNTFEQPVALQLGGSDPREMAACARLAEAYGYAEVNINVGCPSERVQKGAFGACLMAEPALIAECVASMQAAVRIPVTVKNRIGIDEQDEQASLFGFVETVAQAGCQTFIVHARKAWLKGLSPKENRDIPPLNYALVYALKREFPQLEIIINGGITTLAQCQQHLHYVDGVMLGREAYHNPWILAQVDSQIYADIDSFTQRTAVVEAFIPYLEQQLSQGVPLAHMTKHILGLFQGIAGARHWRRYLSENAFKPSADTKILLTALQKILDA